MTRLWRLLAIAIALLASGRPALAHEVRPALLEITERADGRADVFWKQPIQVEQAVHLRPAVDRLIDRAPDAGDRTPGFLVARWSGLDLGGRGLNGRVVHVAGLDRTITDVLLVVRPVRGDETSHVLTPAAPSLTIDTHPGIGVSGYLRLGVGHILTGVDHLLFVLGLILLSDGLRRLLLTITAFTAAHSITLAATALKVIAPDPALIEALVALSIVFLAVELVRKQRGASGLTQRSPWIVAFAFGLLHGAAFAGALRDIGLPAGNIPAALFLFNVGVEVGQLLFVAAVMILLRLLARVRWPHFAPAAARMATIYAIGGLSTFWLLDRLQFAFTTA